MTAKKQQPRLRLWRCFSNRKGIWNLVLPAVTGECVGCQSLIAIGIRPFGVGMKSSIFQNRCLYFFISSGERSVKSSAPRPVMKNVPFMISPVSGSTLFHSVSDFNFDSSSQTRAISSSKGYIACRYPPTVFWHWIPDCVNFSFSWSFSRFNDKYFHMGFLSEPPCRLVWGFASNGIIYGGNP